MDIENELKHYKEHFKDKVVLCNCDDPRVSNFFHYFSYNFEKLGLKKLITTCYKNQERDLFSQNDSERAIWLEYNGDKNNNRVPDPNEIGINYFQGDGDFRSKECIELLKQADIVVTNPPFSLFREYVAQLIEYDKKFLIIGPYNANHYKEIFPLIKNNKLWHGFNSVKGFMTPEKILKKFGNVIWYTNLDHTKRHEKLILYKKFNPKEYPNYINFDAIDVGEISNIPCDYYGIMGVPDTFIGLYNPEQFELIGIVNKDTADDLGVKRIGEKWLNDYKLQGGTGHITANMKNLAMYIGEFAKQPYSRILIRRRLSTQYLQQEGTLSLAAEEETKYNEKQ